MVAGAGTRYVEEVALGVIDLFEVSIVRYRFDPLLLRDHFVIARDDGDGAEFQAFRQVHRADGHAAGLGLQLPVEEMKGMAGCRYRGLRALEFRVGADEYGNLVRRYA
jgi:hypothetical protein